ncbi:unnamed protein product [Haemonchus placei]|uniref:Chitin-binding type-2 domain-containing protein n=1 Tax=Haemonchus placei TaxID=6290 RepID=A0A0N4X235_HAEPC|nr:unnamed protein product [Haemonchus placei]
MDPKGIPPGKGDIVCSLLAELILAGARFYKHPEKDDTTLVDVVMLADLKGLLPKFLVNQILGKIMLMDTEENRRHFQSIRDRKSQRNEQMLLTALLTLLIIVVDGKLLINPNWSNKAPLPNSLLETPNRGCSASPLRPENLWSLCSQNRPHIQLGLCSTHFIECSRTGEGAVIRSCPYKTFVFMNGRCQPAENFAECKDRVLYRINEETKQLVESESFCANFAGIYRSRCGASDCSRQALICHPNGRDAIPVICAAGQVLTEGLECVPAEQWCPSELDLTAPIRQLFLQRTCERGLAPYGSSAQIGRTQCASWYVACRPRPSVIYCGNGEIFDSRLKRCRKWNAGDTCAMAGICRDLAVVADFRGHEWQLVPLGECESEFVSCEGSVGKLYTCQEGNVFNGRYCSPRNVVEACAACRKGERRPGPSCNETFSCHPNTRWDPATKRCVQDFTCMNSNYEQQKQCLEGYTIPSSDCVTYQVCYNGKYVPASCGNFSQTASGPCSHCFSSPSRYTVNQLTIPGQCSAQDRLPHPHDCAAYYACSGGNWVYSRCQVQGQVFDAASKTCRDGTPWGCASYAEVQCRHGERIVDQNSPLCDRRVVECRYGKWVDLRCPDGYVFDEPTLNCVQGVCPNEQKYPGPAGLPGPVVPPPRPPPPPVSNLYQVVPDFVAPSCQGSMRIADQYDCARFWQCETSGRFQSKICPPGKVYNAAAQDCVQGTCYNGQWLDARCNHNKRFVNGRCVQEDCVQQSYGKDHYSKLQCRSGALQPHLTNQHSYMFCQYGMWTERSCHRDGAIFDWKVLGCVVSQSQSNPYKPKCYEGMTRPITNECSVYEESSGVDGYRRMETDCSKYYQCVHGKSITELLQSLSSYLAYEMFL